MAATRSKSTKPVPPKRARAASPPKQVFAKARAGTAQKGATKQPPPAKSESPEFSVGRRVMHRIFGPGTILSIDGEKLEIKFKAVGTKWIIDSFVTPAKPK